MDRLPGTKGEGPGVRWKDNLHRFHRGQISICGRSVITRRGKFGHTAKIRGGSQEKSITFVVNTQIFLEQWKSAAAIPIVLDSMAI